MGSDSTRKSLAGNQAAVAVPVQQDIDLTSESDKDQNALRAELLAQQQCLMQEAEVKAEKAAEMAARKEAAKIAQPQRSEEAVARSSSG